MHAHMAIGTSVITSHSSWHTVSAQDKALMHGWGAESGLMLGYGYAVTSYHCILIKIWFLSLVPQLENE